MTAELRDLRGSRGGGEGDRGEPPPPPCRNIPNPQGTEKLLENEQLSTWKCHVVGRKQRKFIIECQFRVPTSHQYTTMGESLHYALLLDYVPPEDPLGTPLGNTLRIRRPKLDWRGP